MKDSGKTKGCHTPGPWRLEPSTGGGFNVRDLDGNVPGIARTFARFGEPEDTANATLIANAPQMLYALECIVWHIENPDGYEDDEIMGSILSIAESASLRAMGKHPLEERWKE